jgi:hypothetical protein
MDTKMRGKPKKPDQEILRNESIHTCHKNKGKRREQNSSVTDATSRDNLVKFIWFHLDLVCQPADRLLRPFANSHILSRPALKLTCAFS